MRFVALLLSSCVIPIAHAEEIPFLKGRATQVRGNSRTVLRIDPVEHQLIQGKLDTSSWKEVETTADKPFSGPAFNSGYVYFEVISDRPKAMLLEATGHGMVYVNDVPRVGDIYSFGYVSLPVQLKQGKNTFLFSTGRGGFKGKLVDPPAPVSLDLRDTTSPDIMKGENGKLLVAVVVKNATTNDLSDLSIVANGVTTKLPMVLGSTARKVGFEVKPNKDGKYLLNLKQSGKTVHSKPLILRVREANQTHKRTFRSEIDGSVQYYAVTPSTTKGPNQALFLSLHGASVEALSQAESYGAKSWGHVVCPTNRRPFGFDWEDVGRGDALEVFEHAKKYYQTDPSRSYLTGHSMGGHGTWQLGALFPDKFAGIAPCAGWISFNTYAGGATYPATPLGDIFRRASGTSDTLSMKPNLMQNPVFINHGDADDNVPVQQARTMREELKDHKALQWNEEKGGGHWYDSDPEPGANVQDHAPIFSMFSKARIPAMNEVRHIDFVTANPAVNGKCYWLTVTGQEKWGGVSKITGDTYPGLAKVVLTTENVTGLRLDLSTTAPNKTVTVEWNGKKSTHEVGPTGLIELGKAAPDNNGFKQVFANNVIFAYDDRLGNHPSTTWARNKAIYDAEQFWYRGNSSVDVLPMSTVSKLTGNKRNVICYSASLDMKPAIRDAYGYLTTSTAAGVQWAYIGGSSVTGARLTERIPLFSAGVGIPNMLMIEPMMLEKGIEGVVAAGYGNGDMYIRP